MYEFLNNLDFGNDVISLPENANTKLQAQKLMKRVLKMIYAYEEIDYVDYVDIELSRNEVKGQDDNGDKFTVDGSVDMFISVYQNASYKLEASVEVSQMALGSGDKMEYETFAYPSAEFDNFVCKMIDRYFQPLPKE